MPGIERSTPARPAILAVLLLTTLSCGQADRPSQGGDGPVLTALVGATVVVDPGEAPVPDATVLLANGRIRAVQASGAAIPDGAVRVDVSGRTIVPGLINAHGHVGGTLGLEGGHYTSDNLRRQLDLYAAYGVTTVVSLGGDAGEGVALRDAQDTPELDRARLYVAGEVVTGATVEEALEAVQRNVDLGVDYIKIRVDDNLGTTDKMSPDIYAAVTRAAHDAGLPLAAHLFYLEDARGLLNAGADILAHSIRDVPVDDEFIEVMRESGACYVPTLTREVSTFAYGDDPPFFSDPFFLAHADSSVINALLDPERQASARADPAARAYRAGLEVAKTNLAALAAAGIPIALGTDTGPPARFQGYFEHLEMGMMADAGLSPAQILEAATSVAAECMGLSELGTLEPGKWADFLVVDGNPLEDITRLRNIESVWVAGSPLEGA